MGSGVVVSALRVCTRALEFRANALSEQHTVAAASLANGRWTVVATASKVCGTEPEVKVESQSGAGLVEKVVAADA